MQKISSISQQNKQSSNQNGVQSKRSFFNAPFIPQELAIDKPHNISEKEINSIESEMMRMLSNDYAFFQPAANFIQRKCAHCEEEEKLQRKEGSSQPTETGEEVSSYVSHLSSKGSPLSNESKKFFEPRFGHDFSNVRIHKDIDAAISSQSVNALAYTVGNNIVFNQNQFSPGTEGGKKLLAHELTHVVQQRNLSPATNNNPEHSKSSNPTTLKSPGTEVGQSTSVNGIVQAKEEEEHDESPLEKIRNRVSGKDKDERKSDKNVEDLQAKLREILPELIFKIEQVLRVDHHAIEEKAIELAKIKSKGHRGGAGLPQLIPGSSKLSSLIGPLILINGLLSLTSEDLRKKIDDKSTGLFHQVSTISELLSIVGEIVIGAASTLATFTWAVAKVTRQAALASAATGFARVLVLKGAPYLAVLGTIHGLLVLFDPNETLKAQEEALRDIGSNIAFLAGAPEVSILIWWFLKGFSEIHKAHEAGRQQAEAANYIQTYARVVTSALISRTLPQTESTGDERLDEARRKGRADALIYLNHINGQQAEQIGKRLSLVYHNEGNIVRAIETEFAKAAGLGDIVFHTGPRNESLSILGI